MNKLILCEGSTDAILLSYYLGRTCGWEYCHSPKGLNISVDEDRGEAAYWYSRGSDHLLICAVGSKDSFQWFFENRIRSPLFDADAFTQIALMLDRDQEEISEIEEKIRGWLPSVAAKAKNNDWVVQEYRNGYQQTKTLDFLLLVIPLDQQGALETLLLEAISEDEYDKNIVNKSRAYVDDIAQEASRYIGKRRLVLKAYLGVTWAIQSPQKVFKFIDEQLRSVRWEDSEVLSRCFHRIVEI